MATHPRVGLTTRTIPVTGEEQLIVPTPRTIAPGVLEIDTLLGGWERVTAGYLIEGSAPVLVETGSQSSVPGLVGGSANPSGSVPRSWPVWW